MLRRWARNARYSRQTCGECVRPRFQRERGTTIARSRSGLPSTTSAGISSTSQDISKRRVLLLQRGRERQRVNDVADRAQPNDEQATDLAEIRERPSVHPLVTRERARPRLPRRRLEVDERSRVCPRSFPARSQARTPAPASRQMARCTSAPGHTARRELCAPPGP